MSSDWTTARVVRDCDGDLWFRGSEGADADLWTANTNYPDVFLSPDTPDPRIEAAAKAIYTADQQDGDEQCWDTDTDAIRYTYVKLAKAAAEALGVTL